MPLHRVDRETRELADELGALTVFAGLDRRATEALAGSGRVVHLPDSWALISENTPADSCYVLLAGQTEVRHGTEVIATLGAGALVGEAALVEHTRRNASVVSSGQVRALRLGYDDLTSLFTRHPSLEEAFRVEWERKAGV